MTVLPTDSVLVKLFHQGRSDREIAESYGVTVQAVNKRLVALGLRRKPIVRQVNDLLAQAFGSPIKASKSGYSHHNRAPAKGVKVWMRRQLGDTTLSQNQLMTAERWEQKIRREGVVLCYDPDTEEGWYYRPRRPEDGRLVIEWSSEEPLPEDDLLRALELPEEDETDSAA